MANKKQSKGDSRPWPERYHDYEQDAQRARLLPEGPKRESQKNL